MAEDGFRSFGIPAVRFVEDEAGSSHEVLAVLSVTPLPALRATFPLKGGRQTRFKIPNTYFQAE